METIQRLLRAINYNYVLYAVAIIAMLYVVTSRPVVDAVMNFLFAGVVPFSGDVIDPDVMLMGATIALGLVAVNLLIWLLVRCVTARHSVPAVSYSLSIARPSRTPKAVKAATSSATNKKYQAAPSLKLGRRASTQAVDYDMFDRALMAIGNSWSWMGLMIYLTIQGVLNVVSGLSRTLLSGLLRVAVVVLVAVSLTTTTLAAAGYRLLIWLHPYARRFDGWLETKSKAVVDWSLRKLMRYERFQVVAVMVRDSKVTLRQFFK